MRGNVVVQNADLIMLSEERLAERGVAVYRREPTVELIKRLDRAQKILCDSRLNPTYYVDTLRDIIAQTLGDFKLTLAVCRNDLASTHELERHFVERDSLIYSLIPDKNDTLEELISKVGVVAPAIGTLGLNNYPFNQDQNGLQRDLLTQFFQNLENWSDVIACNAQFGEGVLSGYFSSNSTVISLINEIFAQTTAHLFDSKVSTIKPKLTFRKSEIEKVKKEISGFFRSCEKNLVMAGDIHSIILFGNEYEHTFAEKRKKDPSLPYFNSHITPNNSTEVLFANGRVKSPVSIATKLCFEAFGTDLGLLRDRINKISRIKDLIGIQYIVPDDRVRDSIFERLSGKSNSGILLTDDVLRMIREVNYTVSDLQGARLYTIDGTEKSYGTQESYSKSSGYADSKLAQNIRGMIIEVRVRTLKMDTRTKSQNDSASDIKYKTNLKEQFDSATDRCPAFKHCHKLIEQIFSGKDLSSAPSDFFRVEIMNE